MMVQYRQSRAAEIAAALTTAQAKALTEATEISGSIWIKSAHAGTVAALNMNGLVDYEKVPVRLTSLGRRVRFYLMGAQGI